MAGNRQRTNVRLGLENSHKHPLVSWAEAGNFPEGSSVARDWFIFAIVKVKRRSDTHVQVQHPEPLGMVWLYVMGSVSQATMGLGWRLWAVFSEHLEVDKYPDVVSHKTGWLPQSQTAPAVGHCLQKSGPGAPARAVGAWDKCVHLGLQGNTS